MTPRILRARQERGDLGETDFYPTAVSSKRTYWKARTVKLLNFGRAAINRVNKKSKIKYKCGDTCHSDMLEWLQEFRGNLVDNRVLERRDSHASSSHELSLEPTPARSVEVCKYSVYTDFPKAEIARAPPSEDPKDEGLLQKTDWRSRTLWRKLWWCGYSWSESSQWQLRISKQSSICSRFAGFGHPMDPIISVQNKNFSKNSMKLAKVLGAK